MLEVCEANAFKAAVGRGRIEYLSYLLGTERETREIVALVWC